MKLALYRRYFDPKYFNTPSNLSAPCYVFFRGSGKEGWMVWTFAGCGFVLGFLPGAAGAILLLSMESSEQGIQELAPG